MFEIRSATALDSIELDGQVSLLGQCRQRGQKVLYLTGGSGNSVLPKTIDAMQNILRQWLSATNVVTDVLLQTGDTIAFEGKMSEVRTQYGGFFLPRVEAGQQVKAGDPTRNDSARCWRGDSRGRRVLI